MVRALVILTAAGMAFLVAGCSDPAATPIAERPPVAVEVSRVSAGELAESIAVVGTLAPKFRGEVKAEYSGTIAEVYVTEWVPVEKGTLLARFDVREIRAAVEAAEAARLQADVAARRAQRELERAEKLKVAGLATQQFVDDARAAAEAGAAQLAVSSAQVSLARTRLAKADVRAPMAGVIAARNVDPGDFVENVGSPKPMFVIVDNDSLELTLSVPSSAVSRVALGQRVRFTADAIPGRPFEGRVSFINPAVDAASRTARILASVDAAGDSLRSGFFVKGSILTSERKGVLTLPRAALVEWDAQGRSGNVYILSGDRVRRRPVTTGPLAGEIVEIVEGLAPGDAVVTRGAFMVRDGDRVTVVPSPGA